MKTLSTFPIVVACAMALTAQTPVRLGFEFQVNSYTTNDQNYSEVAKGPDGDFVIVWHSFGGYGSDCCRSIQAQRYDESGMALGGQFQVNTTTPYTQRNPEVDIGSDGAFLIVWDSNRSAGSDNSDFSVQAQRFNSNGNFEGSEFQVNSWTTGKQLYPVVAISPTNGEFVVAWESDGSFYDDSSYYSIQAQRYASDGSPLGNQFQVNSITTNKQRFPAIDYDVEGDFVVVWQTETDGYQPGNLISGRKFMGDGTPVGVEFQVNEFSNDFQTTPDVAALPGGDFVVTWSDRGGPGVNYTVQMRLFDPDGVSIGAPFAVNADTTSERLASVASAPNGDFAVVWTGSGFVIGDDTSNSAVIGQLFMADGSPIGDHFQVNDFTTFIQWIPDVAMGPAGEFVVSWQNVSGSYGSDTDQDSVNANRFGGPDVIFATGMDDGSPDEWSGLAPPPP